MCCLDIEDLEEERKKSLLLDESNADSSNRTWYARRVLAATTNLVYNACAAFWSPVTWLSLHLQGCIVNFPSRIVLRILTEHQGYNPPISISEIHSPYILNTHSGQSQNHLPAPNNATGVLYLDMSKREKTDNNFPSNSCTPVQGLCFPHTSTHGNVYRREVSTIIPFRLHIPFSATCYSWLFG